jgi:hypothetical protein
MGKRQNVHADHGVTSPSSHRLSLFALSTYSRRCPPVLDGNVIPCSRICSSRDLIVSESGANLARMRDFVRSVPRNANDSLCRYEDRDRSGRVELNPVGSDAGFHGFPSGSKSIRGK